MRKILSNMATISWLQVPTVGLYLSHAESGWVVGAMVHGVVNYIIMLGVLMAAVQWRDK